MTGSGKVLTRKVSIKLRTYNFPADGIVRLYRNYDPTLEQGPIQMVSAFRALNEIVQSRHGSGLVMDWKQSSGTLLVGGDSRVIKVWDALTETQGLVCRFEYRRMLFHSHFLVGSGDKLGKPCHFHFLRRILENLLS